MSSLTVVCLGFVKFCTVGVMYDLFIYFLSHLKMGFFSCGLTRIVVWLNKCYLWLNLFNPEGLYCVKVVIVSFITEFLFTGI